MKTQSAPLKTHYAQEVTTIIDCWKVIWTKHQPRIVDITQANPGVVTCKWSHNFKTGLKVKIVVVKGMTEVNKQEYIVTVIDGLRFSIDADTTAFSPYLNGGEARRILGFTANVDDLVFDGVTYQSASGYTASALSSRSDLSVDDVELQGLLDAGDIKKEDIEAGRWAGAEVGQFQVNYEDLTMGDMKLPSFGHVGAITIKRPGLYIAELLGFQNVLNRTIGELYSILDRARLGDVRNKVKLDPPRWRETTLYFVRPVADAGLGDVVRPRSYNGRHFKNIQQGTSGLTEPVWDTTIGNQTVDGTAIWETIDALTKESSVSTVIDKGKFTDTTRTETPAAAYSFPISGVSPGASRFDTPSDRSSFFPASRRFKVAGSSGNDKIYSVASSTYNAGADRTEVTVVESEDPKEKKIPDSTADGAMTLGESGWFRYGLVTFLDGANVGIGREVKDYIFTAYPILVVDQGSKKYEIAGDQSGFFTVGGFLYLTDATGNDGRWTIATVTYNGGSDRTELIISETIPDSTVDGNILSRPATIDLFEKFPFPIGVGERYEMEVGYDKFFYTAVGKFDNGHNFRGEPHMPGVDEALAYLEPK